MKLLKIILTDFKGFTGKEIGFFQRTLVDGRNASGKTTLMDAHLWLWTDRDSELKSNPDIFPNDGKECIPRVDEIWEIGGREVTISKFQKMTKKEKDGKETKSFANKYEINGVTKTLRDFKKDLEILGFDFDNFLLLSHPDQFLREVDRDQKKIRAFLFGMAESKTDLEIAQITDGCGDVAKLLESYRMDEIEAMNKASRKKAAEQLEAIPNQIIGKEGAKVDVDVLALQEKKGAILREIENIEKSLSDSAESVKESDKLFTAIRNLKDELNTLSAVENEKINKQRNDIDWQIAELNRKKKDFSFNLKMAEEELYSVERSTERYRKALKEAQEAYKIHINLKFDESKIREIEAEEFDTNTLICPTCGQVYPKEKAENTRADFEKNKKVRLDEQERLRAEFEKKNAEKIKEITENGNRADAGVKDCIEKKKKLEGKIEQFKKCVTSLTAEIESLTAALSKIPESADFSTNETYIILQKQLAEKESQLASMSKSDYRRRKEAELKEKRSELSSIESELAKAENNKRIDEQIADLRQKQREYCQNKADAERVLKHLDLVKRNKNTILVDEINKWFDGVRFEMFEYFNNGEYKECINIHVWNEDEKVWFQIGKSANTALEIKGKLAIISGLQKFFGRSYPVFVDASESMDDKSLSKVRTEFQTIFLKVSNGDLKVREIS